MRRRDCSPTAHRCIRPCHLNFRRARLFSTRDMATVDVPLERIRFGQTKRRDLWWAMPLTTFIVFSSFVVYVTWALLQGNHYHSGTFLWPLYSPELFGDSPHAIFGAWRWKWPIPFVGYSPAM